MLNPDQIAFYEEHGYLVIEGAVTGERLETLQAVTADLIERSREVAESDDVYDLDAGHSPQAPRLTRIKLPHERHRAYLEVLRSDPVASIMQSLVGEDVRLHTSKLNTKAPGGGAAVEWHQDWAFYPHTNDDLFAIGLMLGDVDEANGPLLVIPGTHRGPVLDHSRDGTFCGAIDPDDPAFDVSRAVALTGRAGDMSIHHVRTLHGSAPNLSDRARLLLLYEAGAADAWPIAGGSGLYTGLDQRRVWETLNGRMLTGRQSIVPRLESVPVTMPLPPAKDASSIFKIQQSGGARSAFAGEGKGADAAA